MKIKLQFVLVWCVVCALQGIAQSDVDFDDDVLIGYWIPESEEEMVSTSDGKLSGFWTAWDTLPEGTMDILDMVPSRNGYCKWASCFDGEDDARAEFRVAWGLKGLYLLMEITDDYWSDPLGEADETSRETGAGANLDWAYDVCDLKFDKLTHQEMIEAPENNPDVFVPKDRYSSVNCVTKTHNQFMYRVGGAEPATEFVYYQWEESINTRFNYKLDFDIAADQYHGMGIEVVIYPDNTGMRHVEWYVPWSMVTSVGIPQPLVYDKIGFVFGYNDNDGTRGSTDNLRKYPGTGHWERRYEIDPATGDTIDSMPTYDCYMDMEFGQHIPIGDPASVQNRLQTQTINEAGMSIKEEYFGIDGRKIEPGSLQKSHSSPVNGLVIKRATLPGGIRKTRRYIRQ
jgi:hypothetical protein